MGGRSPNFKPTSANYQGNPTLMMEADFRLGYKGKVRRDFDPFLDTLGNRSTFKAYRAIHGGMIVSHTIESEHEPGRNVRMINWYFRRARSTPIPLVIWAGNAQVGFPEGSLDPRMIKMIPTLKQQGFMIFPQWQRLREKRRSRKHMIELKRTVPPV